MQAKNIIYQAFTLVELLVVIVVIGILATLAIVAFSGTRTSARDARRISDIKQTQTALELFFSDEGRYPSADEFKIGQAFTDLSGSKVYMAKVPAAPEPAIEGACALPGYVYNQDLDGGSYHINWCLAKKIQDIGPGACIATPGNICYACNNNTCDGKCGGYDECGVPCPSTCQAPAFCDTTTNNCIECYSDTDCSEQGNKTTCQSNVCVCVPKTDDVLKAENCSGKDCGTVNVTDNCGVSRTVVCGPDDCSNSFYTCGGGGTANVCGCTNESDADFCTRLGAACGSKTGTDKCGNVRTVSNCGNCFDNDSCTNDMCSQNLCSYPQKCNSGEYCNASTSYQCCKDVYGWGPEVIVYYDSKKYGNLPPLTCCQAIGCGVAYGCKLTRCSSLYNSVIGNCNVKLYTTCY